VTTERPTVLIVDDNADKLVALESIMLPLDVDLVTAQSGREALRRLLERDFAVILLDVRMPGMDGFETATMIRERQRSANTPIIFITAFAGDARRQNCSCGRSTIMAPVVPEVRGRVSVWSALPRRPRSVARPNRYAAGRPAPSVDARVAGDRAADSIDAM
jgi:CheY-like chemotaxis protein